MPIEGSNYAELKFHAFSALAHYEQGKEHKGASEFGSELSRYKLAMVAINNAANFIPKVFMIFCTVPLFPERTTAGIPMR